MGGVTDHCIPLSLFSYLRFRILNYVLYMVNGSAVSMKIFGGGLKVIFTNHYFGGRNYEIYFSKNTFFA